ncbi:MAG: carboxypeptidase regulatory-like domain-containing protein [Bacteroidales bacterium]
MKTLIRSNFAKTEAPLKSLLFFSLFSLVFTGASGQGAIHGKVIDKEEGTTIPGAHVVIRVGNTVIADVTDTDGKYRLRPLDAGTYDLEITYMGYQDAEITKVEVFSDKITRLEEIYLGRGVDLEPVVIRWEEPLIDETGGMKYTMNSKDYEKLPNNHDIKGSLTTISTDLSMDQNTREIHFRGSRADDFIYIIDGVKQRGGEANIPSGAVKSITVYAGGIPAQFGDFTGGVIVIETKGYFDWVAQQD